MSTDKIREHIAELNDRLSTAFASDSEFGRYLLEILNLINLKGIDIRITVTLRYNAAPVADYAPNPVFRRAILTP
jgi:hypothetical protein